MNSELIKGLTSVVRSEHVLRGADTDGYIADVTGKYTSTPLAVVRPADTDQVSAVVKLAAHAGAAIVPISGNTGLVGGTQNDGAIMLSLERMNQILEVRGDARIAIVQAGVVIANLQDAIDNDGLIFPLLFGARGSAMIGGVLSTNAGGSNVLRYGNTRALCLGLEVVLPSGEVMNLMSELHKDNSGYDLRDLFIGAEGTLGIITKAVVKLFPKPRAYATAMVAVPDLNAALGLLNELQLITGGAVEAFEYMPRDFIELHCAHFTDARPPFEQPYEINILVEVGATAPRDAEIQADGSTPVTTLLIETLVDMMETGAVLDAVVAQNEAQRAQMWQRRESAAEVVFAISPRVDTDISLALDKVAVFYDQITPLLTALDPTMKTTSVAHLGDGNIHFSIMPTSPDKIVADQIMETVEDVVKSLDGSFSAEHGVGLSKKPSMARRKDAVALNTMRQIKMALDPQNIMNPHKVLPD